MRAVLFDLDGTLLDIDLRGFLATYFHGLGPVVAEVIDDTPQAGLDAVLDATDAMMRPHPGQTNQQVFAARFEEITRVALGAGEWDRFDRFYRDVFPSFGAGHGPRPGAHEAVRQAQALGLRVAVATNPIFPLIAIRERMRWAQVEQVQFDVVTSYENMTACKPQHEYFLETAEMLGVSPGDCLMVGDDRSLDLAAADVGMLTFYCGPDQDAVADLTGDLWDLEHVLPRLL